MYFIIDKNKNTIDYLFLIISTRQNAIKILEAISSELKNETIIIN
jgi:hypothetical protein